MGNPDPPEALVQIWTKLVAAVANGELTAAEASKMYRQSRELFEEKSGNGTKNRT